VGDTPDKQLVDACVAGDGPARASFQAEFLPVIYRFERGGAEHEAASHDFITFLFEDDRLYRRLRSYRGAAPLGAYLVTTILPDLTKQFRTMLRRRGLDTTPFEDGSRYGTPADCPERSEPEGNRTAGASAVLDALAPDKRLLLKLLYIEDFDVAADEIQRLADRSRRSIREVLDRVATAREAVRSREAVQHERVEAAASAGQWIRIYQRQMAQIDEDLLAVAPDTPQAHRLRARRTDLLRKLDHRRRQLTERLRASWHTVVTVPTDMVADLLGQSEATTRSQITRARQELAARFAAGTAPNAPAVAQRDGAFAATPPGERS